MVAVYAVSATLTYSVTPREPGRKPIHVKGRVQRPYSKGQSGGTISCDIGPPYTGSIPVAAARTGLNHCAANYDFSYSGSWTDQLGTHRWSNLSSWRICSNTTAAPYLWKYTGGSQPCDSRHQNVIKDPTTGIQVLALSNYLADNNPEQVAHFQNLGVHNGVVQENFLPSQYYIELAIRFTTNRPAASGYSVLLDISTFSTVQGCPAFSSIDLEMTQNDPVGVVGVGPTVWNPVSPTCGGNGVGVIATPINADVLAELSVYGSLLEMDGSFGFVGCDFVHRGYVQSLRAEDFLSCTSPHPKPPSPDGTYFYTLMGNYLLTAPGRSSPHTVDFTAYVYRITIWTCADYQSGSATTTVGCFTNPMVTSFR